jgi:hypothetical protein
MALRCALIHRHTMENKLYEPVQRGLAYGIDTEIDWRAYMEQVEQILAGERDYAVIKGGTGPLWYIPCLLLRRFRWLLRWREDKW